LEFYDGDLTEQEKQLSKMLYDKKYTKDEWVYGREMINIT